MAAPVNLSEVINRQTGGNSGNPEIVFFFKDRTGITNTSGVICSAWKFKGQPGIGPTPTSAAIPTAATAGAMRFTNPTGGRKRWLRNMSGHGWTSNRVVLYDRLLHCGGFSGTSTSAQACGTSINRYTGAESFGNLMVAEVYTQLGATGVSVTCNYLDASGTTRASNSVPFGGNFGRQPGDMVIIPFNTTLGANSVTQVVDATLSSSSGAVGNWGITILRPIAEIITGPVDTSAFGSGSRMLALEDIELKTDACLTIFEQGPAATSNLLRCSISSVEN